MASWCAPHGPNRDVVRVPTTLREACAGRAVVQFVKVPRTGDVCALKFFASRAAFEGERRLYMHSTAGRFMPTVLAFEPNEDGRFCDPFDNPMPPCIVMEKGELLTERSPLAADDAATTAQVCSPPCAAVDVARACVLQRWMVTANCYSTAYGKQMTRIPFG